MDTQAVLATGVYGRCGTAIIDHLHDRDDYEFSFYNRSDRPDDHPYGGHDTIVADITDSQALHNAATGHDALVHLAAYPYPEGGWEDVVEPNIIGTYNALEAARAAEMETFVFLSSNHVMGGYEHEHAPEIYSRGYPLVLDHTDPVRPDSLYAVTKVFGEALARFFSDTYDYPVRCYVLRTGSVRMPEYDHPFGLAEYAADHGEIERDSAEYDRKVARMRATWQSRRDFAHQVDRCLADTTVKFGIFNGVSDNRRRWFDLEYPRSRIQYDPQDDGEIRDSPPA